MSDLPPGWEWSTLGEIADIQGGIQKQAKRRPVKNAYPFLRVANVARGSLDLSDVHDIELFDGEIDRWRLRLGDLLVVEGNGSLSQLGRAAMWNEQIPNCVHQNHLIRVRPSPGIDPKYLLLLWNSDLVARQLAQVGASTSGLHTLSVAKLRPVRVPVAAMAEQLRIVATLEWQLSKLDVGRSELASAARKLRAARDSALNDAVTAPLKDSWLRLTDVATDARYGTSLKCSYDGSGPAVLRIPNIQSGRIDLSDMKRATSDSPELERLAVKKGDLLIVRTNGAKSLIGRSAAAQRDLDCAFASYLIRFRFDESVVLADWVQLCLDSPRIRRSIEELAASSAGQYNLSIAKLNGLKVPIPSIENQRESLRRFSKFSSSLFTLDRHMSDVQVGSTNLRQSLLADAFAGRLVPQGPTDEPASVLLERIRAERAAAPKPKRSRRGPRTDPAQETLS